MSRKTLIILCWLFVIVAFSFSVLPREGLESALGQGSQSGSQQSNSDTQLLARCVNGEARGESYLGQCAVAAVILNRVDHPSFPNTLSGVIYQPGAFTAVSDGQINVPIASDSQVYKACRDAMNGYDPTGGAIYYYNPEKTTNKWIYSREVIKTIGKHKFAK
ncbi:MAG: Spore cortex-lytic enzyme precursor [Firmicutes bacterium ADurb.Bin193]|nr:MAG: Spore cortex-lytic enzyme precursor [Firmicutes bacterium ADurb.Bin193]